MEITAKVKIETTKGDFIVGLYGTEVPVTTANFLQYVNAGFYSNLLFHRVVPEFCIQGGGFIAGMFEKKPPFPSIKLEISPNIKHGKYVLSMARTEDKNSATSQFFVCNGDDVSELDGEYAAFGIVLEGQSVIDEISAAKTKTVRVFDDVPEEKIVIKKASVI